MFGAIVRAAPQALFVALLGAVTARVANPLIAQAAAGSATKQDTLLAGLVTLTDNFVLVGILALLLTLLARAVLEAQVAGGGI